jgi:hypothetical protein
MTVKERVKHIGGELLAHSPFTLIGAGLGILFMILFRDISAQNALRLFAVFHPLHVLLSAMVTAALFKLHRKAAHFIVILVVGYLGSIGTATLSDCLLPYWGQTFLGVVIPTESAVHTLGGQEHIHDADCEHEHDHEGLHLGFIEEWYLVNPAALMGILLAYFWPRTKTPHAAHILISTWASASFMLMNSPAEFGFTMIIGMFVVLFIAVWLPCCVSDIVFPSMFVRPDGVHVGHHGCVFCGHKESPQSAGENHGAH